MNLINCYIGYSLDENIRYKSTSGGIGTSIVKYLLEKKLVDCALSFKYNSNLKRYEPVLINSFLDYDITGSVYHEIDMATCLHSIFCERNKNRRMVIFSLPCYTPLAKHLAKKYCIELFVIGLTCSSQQSIEATKYLYKRLDINEEKVKKIRYRGNGWPSGICIEIKDGKQLFVPNNNSLWEQIFHSRLFIPQKCFKCNDTLNKHSDIVLADPWLPEYYGKEKIGKTIIGVYTSLGGEIVSKAIKDLYIQCQMIDNSLLYASQKSTLDRKKSYFCDKKTTNFLIRICQSNLYKKIVLSVPFFFGLHVIFKNRVERKLLEKLYRQNQ